QAEDGIRDRNVTGVQTCALPISSGRQKPVLARADIGQRDGVSTRRDFLVLELHYVARGASRLVERTAGDGPEFTRVFLVAKPQRSEERRVGKGGRCRGWGCDGEE